MFGKVRSLCHSSQRIGAAEFVFPAWTGFHSEPSDILVMIGREDDLLRLMEEEESAE